MKKVITYGTFDLFHEGHRRLLERARALGDYLIVGVTADSYDLERGKLNVRESVSKRVESVKESGLADEVIIEEYEGQKIRDIKRYSIDIFTVGSDWLGKFDFLNDFCEVCYLERTKGVSSTKSRMMASGVVSLGVVGHGRIAERFVKESKYVSGVDVCGVLGRDIARANAFKENNELAFATTSYKHFQELVDAVYIATPHATHFEIAKFFLEQGKHVLVEKPMALSKAEVECLYEIANSNGCVVLEAVKTAFAPGFNRLVNIARSGIIGEIKNIDATFTKLMQRGGREFDREMAGGAVTELSTYPLLVAAKLVGRDFNSVNFISYKDETTNVDLFTKFTILYRNAVVTGKVGIGVKSEGDLHISGTRGYIYVPAPWWQTEYFECRYENGSKKRYCVSWEGDGLRYELSRFIQLIGGNSIDSHELEMEDSFFMAEIIERYLAGDHVSWIS